MTIKLKTAAFAAALMLGGTATMMMPASASAGTLQLNLQPLTADTGQSVLPVEKVGHRRNARRHRASRRYSRRAHRRSHRRYRRHRNDALWYGLPLFLGAAAIANSYDNSYGYSEPTPYYRQPVRRSGNHVSWCLNRYRSYSPRTDQYLAYSGRYHYCRSPYRR